MLQPVFYEMCNEYSGAVVAGWRRLFTRYPVAVYPGEAYVQGKSAAIFPAALLSLRPAIFAKTGNIGEIESQHGIAKAHGYK